MLMHRLGETTGKVNLPAQGDALPWRTGQILRARVLETGRENVILFLAGRKLRVQSEVPLEKGQELQLLVVGKGQGGGLILRVIKSSSAGTHRPDLARVDRLLGEMGVETTPANIRLAAELIRQGFAVTPDTLTLLGRALGRRDPSPAEAMVLVWLWGRGLPLKDSLVKPLVSLFQETAPDLLQALFSALAARQGEGRQILQQLLFSPSREGGRVLQDLPHLVGIDYEAFLGSTLSSREDGEEVSTGGAGADVRLLVGKKSLKSFLLALGQGDRGELPVELNKGLLAKITGLQLLMAGPWSLHSMGWLDLPGQAPPFFLSVQEEEKGGGGGKERCLDVVLFLPLPTLGPVLVELRCGSVLVLSLTVEKERARRVLDGYRQRLLAAMEDLPWQVQVLPCRIRKAGTVQEAWLRRLISPPHVRRQVDVRI